jgi:hypothetical protein
MFGYSPTTHRRLLEPIGSVPPAEAEAAFYETLDLENELAPVSTGHMA